MKIIHAAFAVCVALTLVSSATGTFQIRVHAAARNAPLPATATTTSHGLAIALSVPQGVYRVNALVATTATVKNVSSKGIAIIQFACLPSIRMVVLDKKGQPYPPPVNFHAPSCGPYRPPKTLSPGAVLRTTSVVLLRSGLLRADLGIVAGLSGPVAISGKVLALKLVPGPAEHVALTSGTPVHPGAGFTATIWPARKGAGSMHVAFWQSCRQANGTGDDTGTWPGQFVTAPGSVLHTVILRPGCRHQLWQFVAGWLGYPVAKLDLSVSAS